MLGSQVQIRRRVGLAVALSGVVVALGAIAAPAAAMAETPPSAAAGSVDFGAVTLVEGGAAVTASVTITCGPGTVSPVPFGLKIVQVDLNGGVASGAVTGIGSCGEPTTVALHSTGDLFAVGPASGQVYALQAGGPVTRARHFQIMG
ncbi:hypothetical protein [Agromyces silvae]|uniref:hypothetical protein n=1 Tax=Agromyces silvae TaxID=3388266 RepID=UPI00280BD60E|nr:hypothetical protein [Agromyces protaetiae]